MMIDPIAAIAIAALLFLAAAAAWRKVRTG